MLGDLPEAALRLYCALPVRTHEWQPPVYEKKTSSPGAKRIVTGRGRGGNNRRPITINGKRFDTLKAARENLKIGNGTIKQMLADGRATR